MDTTFKNQYDIHEVCSAVLKMLSAEVSTESFHSRNIIVNVQYKGMESFIYRAYRLSPVWGCPPPGPASSGWPPGTGSASSARSSARDTRPAPARLTCACAQSKFFSTLTYITYIETWRLHTFRGAFLTQLTFSILIKDCRNIPVHIVNVYFASLTAKIKINCVKNTVA